MKNLIVVGAGGFGREISVVARESRDYNREFVVKGFLDANEHALDKFINYPPILGDVATYEIEEDDVFVVAIGDIATKKKLVAILQERGAKFQSVIHKSVYIGQNVKIGEGVIALNNSVITVDISIGNHVMISQNVIVGHDCEIGDFSELYAATSLGGGVKVGSGVAIYPGSRIVPRRKIGDDAVVGIGSVVLLNVAPSSRVFGSPAKAIFQ